MSPSRSCRAVAMWSLSYALTTASSASPLVFHVIHITATSVRVMSDVFGIGKGTCCLVFLQGHKVSGPVDIWLRVFRAF